MVTVLADIAHGQTTLADICFLIACILLLAAGVMDISRRATETALIAIGLGLVALALLVL